MASIFPSNGSAPGVNNTGVDLDAPPATGCEALYYNEVCAQKVDPKASNAVISELVTVFNACSSLVWNCATRDNLLKALRCLFGGSAANLMIFSTPGTYTFTVPNGVTALDVEVLAGGGAGGATADGTGGSIAGNAGGGGGAGGYARKLCTVTPGQVISVVVGDGGAPVGNANGANGASSSFGSYCSATGGIGGAWGANTLNETGVGGTGSGGDLNIPGGNGGSTSDNLSTYNNNLKLHVLNKGGLAPLGYGTVPWFGTGAGGIGFGAGGNGASGGSGLPPSAGGAPGLVIVKW